MGDRVGLVEGLERRWRGDGGRFGRDATLPRVAQGAAHADGGHDEAEENAPAFGAYRGVRERALHLEFQRLKGSWPSFGYAWLTSLEWTPSGLAAGRGQVIVLRYATGHAVTVRGRNLRGLHERILRQQAYRITEMGETMDPLTPEEATVVYALEIEDAERGHT